MSYFLSIKTKQLYTPAELDAKYERLTRHLGMTASQLLLSAPKLRRADSLGYHPGKDACYEEGGLKFANMYTPTSDAS